MSEPSVLIEDIKYAARITPVLISAEVHNIDTGIPYSIQLKEKPSEDYAVTISGYTKVTSIPTSATNFYVDYARSIIYFHSSKAGVQVEVSYWGLGSPIIAEDVNRFSSFLDNIDAVLFSFLVEALSGSRVRLYGGNFIYGTTIYPKKELFLDFSENGNYPISLTAGYFKKVLIGIYLSTQLVGVVAGAESSKYEGARIPTYTSDFRPVAIVTIGSDFNILQKDIISIRNFLI